MQILLPFLYRDDYERAGEEEEACRITRLKVIIEKNRSGRVEQGGVNLPERI